MKKVIKQSTLTYILNGCSFLLLCAIVVGFLFVFLMNARISQGNDDRFELTKNANRFMNGSSYLTNEVRAYAATGHQVHYDNYYNEINELKNRDISLENMKEIGITDEEQAKIDEMSVLSNKLVPLEEMAMADVRAGRMSDAIEYVYGDAYTNSINKINAIKTEFLDMLDSRTRQEIDRLSGFNRILQISTFIMIVLVAAMQVITFYFMRKRVLNPIATVEKEMEEIAKGNITFKTVLQADTSEIGMLVYAMHNTKATLREYVSDISEKLQEIARGNIDLKIDTQYNGDFAPIQQALETIIKSLNYTLRQINTASDQVATGSDQVSSGAQALAAGSTEQAASVQELSASIERIADQATENAATVNVAADYIDQASAGVNEGNQHMVQLTNAIAEIGSSSNEIANISKVIEDIAFQTNILALNAAIEAARAGSAGKGFAVVADEVRSLAAKSSEAAKQTGALIQACVDSVKKGTKITGETAQILQDVGVKAQKVNESFARIEQSSAEQANAIDQIKQGLMQISSVVQTNAATAEENSATSEEISAQAAMLREEVNRFKLAGGLSRGATSAASTYDGMPSQDFSSETAFSYGKY